MLDSTSITVSNTAGAMTSGPRKPFTPAAGKSSDFGPPDHSAKDFLSTGVWGGDSAAAGGISKGLESIAWDAIDTNLDVWGVFWVDDPSCGPVPEYGTADYAIDEQGRKILKTGAVLPRA